MDKTSTPGTVETNLLYIGRKYPDTDRHAYIRQDTNETVYFKGKLHKSHEIGDLYKVTITDGKSYSRSDEYVETWENMDEIAAWVRHDEQVAREVKRKREQKTLERLARKAAQSLKAEYKRAVAFDRAKMIKAFVSELER
jgi:CRISPR/Cas system-associated exonuclease Cas4 (RecB family)